MKMFSLLMFASLVMSQAALADQSPLTVGYLRCEYRINPSGIDQLRPRLSWVLESSRRAQKQTAYQVVVATSAEKLAAGQSDLWDSGKVPGDDTTAVVYAGRALTSGVRVFWKVKVWDKSDRPSAWSQSATWSMGLLDPSDWKAQWIGCDKFRTPPAIEAEMDGAKWIWHAADPSPNPPKGQRLFYSTFTLPKTAVVKAKLLVTAADGVHVVLNTNQLASIPPGKDECRQVRVVDVTDKLKPGVNDIRAVVQKTAPGAAGLLVKLSITTADGKTITHVTDGAWKSTDKIGGNWQNRRLDTGALPAIRVVGDYGCKPWGKLTIIRRFAPPACYLRTGFQADKPVRRATLYASALGIFDLELNGRRVADEYFNPGWTDYTKRVYYRAYDVTGLMRQGDNALGAILADGWYSGFIGFFGQREHYGKSPRFLGQLAIEYADGSTAIVASGPDWKASTGPTGVSDFLEGEEYDARRELHGWSEPGFDASAWNAVDLGAELKPVVEAHPGPPVTVYEEFRAKKITEPKPGVYVLDLGQNLAGVERLKVSGEPGRKITLRFAERLNPDGTIYTANLRTARATDIYICRGAGTEVWQPRFTYHGFQYVELTGLRQPPTPETVVALAMSSDTPVVGRFECSNPMLNRLHSNVYYTQRSNFIDIPTDCPQRDERLGWTGDAQVYIRTATLNTDVQAFFTKWLVDIEDGQCADGQIPMVVPVKVAGENSSPAWADAGTVCPWTIYEVYGDRRVLERLYGLMARFIEFCRKRSTPELLPPKDFLCFGDWLNINAATPPEVICTAYFAYSTRLTARTAEVLGKSDDAAKYRKMFEQIKASFNRAYVTADGRIKGDTQTCYVLALAFDLLDPPQQKLAAKHLVDDIQRRGWHLSTGFIGTKYLMLVLTKIGRPDVAYRLLLNDTFPSWGFSIKQGATSIWERWDGWTPERGFQTPSMNSFAHYSFGAVYQWMVENIGGIRNDGPAYKQILIAPKPGGGLTWAKVGYRSIHGQIESDWKIEGGRFLLDVTIPANTTATVSIPAAKASEVTESEQAIEAAEGVKLLRVEDGAAVLAVESGTYHFAALAQGRVSRKIDD